MGNCIRKESSEHWGGDDWGSFGSGETSNTIIGASPARTEVKIRISKKQLKHLLGKGDSEEDIMARLIQIGGDWPAADRRTWTPALGSIPESP
ncbi:Expression of the gene is downregulated in the presence of paraquat- an inducer of photoxidative stress [Striga hermonthica]|uniref:Expression of the gene is downregulated in the presence of paraquat- an inducer of photoxidative stress n=1 Tax=Striga hermonthica TaxID=68872 RepID=A0A9N7MTN1_STRHE|nr:Expression of the gene is downregulated in the presence of paraquat- an inducer of photoxidative stress [Striga hermonthica]